MKRTTMIAVTALVAMSGSAAAETSGIGHGTVESEYIAVSDNFMLINARVIYSDITSDDMSNPLLHATGVCAGAIVVDAGAVSGGGYCHYTDAATEQVVIRWDAETLSAEGRTLGTWNVVGGTGPWTSMSGGGRFDAGTDADGVYTNNITGDFSTN